ncbi:MAG: polysaccharide deacetylase family protein [Bacteroidetes bacterium]|nr:MAG: polysaccharide deacetylase family protein [Bacteroidota bacterium]
MYLKHIPTAVQRVYPHYLWRMPTNERQLYLTFDDGPHPEVTPWVLAQLRAHQARATFFLLGEQVRQYPGLAHAIIDEGHTIGNHSQSHLHAYQTGHKRFLRDVLEGRQTIAEYTGIKTRLFRPPYGRLTPFQAHRLRKRFRIVMMDVIPGDFDPERSGEACFRSVKKYAVPGSIILLHDSPKAWDRLFPSLPRILSHFGEAGFAFHAIPRHRSGF